VGAGSYKLLAGEEDRKAPRTEQKATAKEPANEEKIEVQLPSDSPPIQALVSLSQDGRLTVKYLSIVMKQVSPQANDGRTSIPLYRYERQTNIFHYDLGAVEVLDSKGQKVAKERLPELLKHEILALTYSGREEPDPLHFRVIKDGILVFVLPPHNPAALPLLPRPPVNPPQWEQHEHTPRLQDQSTNPAAFPIKQEFAGALLTRPLQRG
jgi:hypothetical protein